jgi:hypothetical protein
MYGDSLGAHTGLSLSEPCPTRLTGIQKKVGWKNALIGFQTHTQPTSHISEKYHAKRTLTYLVLMLFRN